MTKIKRNIQVDTIFNILGLTVSGWSKEYKKITKFLSPEPKAKCEHEFGVYFGETCEKCGVKRIIKTPPQSDKAECECDCHHLKGIVACHCDCESDQSKAEKKIEHLNLANWIPSKSISGKKRVANVEIMIENKINQIIDLLNSEKK